MVLAPDLYCRVAQAYWGEVKKLKLPLDKRMKNCFNFN